MHTPRTRPAAFPFAALLLLATALPVLATVPTRTDTLTEAEAQPEEQWKPFDAYPVVLYDFDGDGAKEIVSHNDNKVLYVLRRDGVLLAELDTTFPQGWGARTINGVAVERMQPGGPPSIIATNSAAYVTRFDFDSGASNATHFDFDKKWERRMTAHHGNPGMDAKPVLGDANGNGDYEIYVQVEEMGLYALRKDGTYLWTRNQSGGNAEPVVADGDRDGHLETYFFSDNGMVRVYDSWTGAFEWSYDAKTQIGSPGSIPRGGTVAQVNGVGRWEVVFCARDAHDASNITNNHMGLFVINNDDMNTAGNLVWFRQPSWAAPLCYTRPVVHDYNGNGQPEIYGMDWNTMGHSPGNWERTGPAHVFSYSKTGALLWMTTLDTWWSNKDIAIADFDGDAQRELLASGPSAGGSHDGWWVLNIANGTKERFLDAWPYKSARGPRLADVDGDGDVDFVLPVQGLGPGTNSSEGAFQVWDVQTPAWRVSWSGGEDGYRAPAGFGAAFEPHPDSNTGYVKVKVRSWHHVVKAWFNEDGGPWQNLTKIGQGSDWTLWHKSTGVPAGTEVRFRAEDDLGGQRTSGPVEWPP